MGFLAGGPGKPLWRKCHLSRPDGGGSVSDVTSEVRAKVRRWSSPGVSKAPWRPARLEAPRPTGPGKDLGFYK